MSICRPRREGRRIVLCNEKSESRRGLHKRRRIPLVIRGDSISNPEGDARPSKPLYAVGEAYEIYVEARPGELYAQVDLVMNPWKRVKGYIEIYDDSGNMLIRAKYAKLKLRLSMGVAKYGRLVEMIARSLKIPYKNVNW